MVWVLVEVSHVVAGTLEVEAALEDRLGRAAWVERTGRRIGLVRRRGQGTGDGLRGLR